MNKQQLELQIEMLKEMIVKLQIELTLSLEPNRTKSQRKMLDNLIARLKEYEKLLEDFNNVQ